MAELSCVDLFSGIGGMALAAERAGFKLDMLCEIEPFCRAVLIDHWPCIAIVEDVHDVHKESPSGRRWGGRHGPALLTGAFPFQATYARGERRENDPHSLWDQFARVARELRPTWIVAETIPRFVHLGIDEAAWDLEREGYSVTALVLPSHAVDCPARRDRLYLVGALRAYSRPPEHNGPGPTVERWPDPPPSLHRVARGLPGRLDHDIDALVALGDATVPRSAEVVLRHIAAFERQLAAEGVTDELPDSRSDLETRPPAPRAVTR